MPETILRPTTVTSLRGMVRAGFHADPNLVYVGRGNSRFGLSHSIWNSPFCVHGERVSVRNLPHRNGWKRWLQERRVEHLGLSPRWLAHWAYASWIETRPDLLARVPDLVGKVLACYCGEWAPGEPPIPCHAVILADLANTQAWRPAEFANLTHFAAMEPPPCPKP